MNRSTLQKLVSAIRAFASQEKLIKGYCADILAAILAGDFDDIREGNDFVLFTDSRLRNTIHLTEPYDKEEVDMEAVKAHYAAIGEPLPTKIKHYKHSIRIN